MRLAFPAEDRHRLDPARLQVGAGRGRRRGRTGRGWPSSRPRRTAARPRAPACCCSSARSASSPAREGSGRTRPRNACAPGIGRTDIVTSVITPKAPSLPEHQLAQVGSGGAARRAAEVQGAGRGRDGEADDQFVAAAVAGGGLTGRTRRRVAADGRELVGLREVAEGVAAGGEQRLGLRAAQPGLQGGGVGNDVEVDQPVEAGQVERDDASNRRAAARPRRRRWCPRRTGTTAMRSCAHSLSSSSTCAGRVTEHDRVRRPGGVAGPDPHQVAVGLSAGVGHPRLGVVTDRGDRRRAGGAAPAPRAEGASSMSSSGTGAGGATSRPAKALGRGTPGTGAVSPGRRAGSPQPFQVAALGWLRPRFLPEQTCSTDQYGAVRCDM